MILHERYRPFADYIRNVKKESFYPYFRTISCSWGPEVEVDGHKLVMVGSNDYLGLSHDPRVMERASKTLESWGTGPGGSRFLCGNMILHEMLEERLAAFIGKKYALVHATGFCTNLGAISSLVNPQDYILYDKENHASIFEGCRASGARIVPFAHNDAAAVEKKLNRILDKNPEACVMLITEGVFSMSGDMAPLKEMAELKKRFPGLYIYIDDAHGLGVMGPSGRGSVNHFNVGSQVDFIMGTFSKALASVGGFIASDHDDIITYLKHHSRTLIFSAALPAANIATVLTCLDILEKEPERVEKVHEITRRVRAGYREIGLCTRDSETPIVPIYIGSEEKAAHFSRDLFDNGVFALPVVYPAVPKGQAIIRTAFMSTHTQKHIDFVLNVLDGLARKYRIRFSDLEDEADISDFSGFTSEKVCAAS